MHRLNIRAAKASRSPRFVPLAALLLLASMVGTAMASQVAGDSIGTIVNKPGSQSRTTVTTTTSVGKTGTATSRTSAQTPTKAASAAKR